MTDETKPKVDESIDEVVKDLSELTVLSFRKIDEVKRLAKHFRNVINHPLTSEKSTIHNYLKNLDETHRNIFIKKREGVEVEYIFTTEKKSNVQRQRFNSLPVSEVPELLKAELLTAEDAQQVHICTDCNVEIELNDEEPLMESLQKHFNLDIHLPKLKRESIDVAEPVILPNMSRRLSALECGETPAQNLEQVVQTLKPTETLDKAFSSKLEASLIRYLPDNSEASIDAALKFYQRTFDKLCQDVSTIEFSNFTSSVAPIIMSIKDNVNQNFVLDTNKNFENEDNELNADKSKNLVKKYRYYGPIEDEIVKLLSNHKLLSLVDERTGKLAFFCMACEYYTLRFRYDSVLNHVFSVMHINNLACILKADKHIPFITEKRCIEKINEMNKEFLRYHNLSYNGKRARCGLCKVTTTTREDSVLHMLDEYHLGKLSNKLYRSAIIDNPDGQNFEEWGSKSLDWAKFLASAKKPCSDSDYIVIENFIDPMGKHLNFCTCCEMLLKGPRQVVFNHIRQKKHLRNAAPRKLTTLYKNYCRSSEYFASFGNFYVCAVCPKYVALPSFGAIVEHFESSLHVETIAKLIKSALYSENVDQDILTVNKITTANDEIMCGYCDITFKDVNEAIVHVLSNVHHQNAVVEENTKVNKGDIISVYMKGNYILHSEGASFSCVSCNGVFNSIRSLLSHLVFANHFVDKPTTENVFRFYLELKHNINMLGRNKYIYYEFGKLKCGVCETDVDEVENAKRHVVSARHRENMGASYVQVNLDVSAME